MIEKAKATPRKKRVTSRHLNEHFQILNPENTARMGIETVIVFNSIFSLIEREAFLFNQLSS